MDNCLALPVLAQILLGVQRQLQQAFQQLIRRNADEVLEHKLFGEQATDVTAVSYTHLTLPTILRV